MPSDAQSSGNEQAIDGFKGFDRTLRCRGFQYEIGETYTMDGWGQVCAREMREIPDGHRCDSVACGITGVGGIKAGVWYRCVGSALVEVEGQEFPR